VIDVSKDEPAPERPPRRPRLQHRARRRHRFGGKAAPANFGSCRPVLS